MDLNSIIPKTGEWKVSKNRAFVWNIAWIPVFDIISDSEINIFLYIFDFEHAFECIFIWIFKLVHGPCHMVAKM